VPIGHAEARRLAALVDSFPEPRRALVRERFAAALQQLKSTGLLRELEIFSAAESGARSAEHGRQLARRYFDQRIPCPFLE